MSEPSWTTAVSEAKSASRHLAQALASTERLSRELEALRETSEVTARLELARALTEGPDGGALALLAAQASDPATDPALRRTAEILLDRLTRSLGLEPTGERGEHPAAAARRACRVRTPRTRKCIRGRRGALSLLRHPPGLVARRAHRGSPARRGRQALRSRGFKSSTPRTTKAGADVNQPRLGSPPAAGRREVQRRRAVEALPHPPVGRFTWKAAPRRLLTTSICPPMLRRRSRASVSPMPGASSRVVKWGSNTSFLAGAVIGGPLFSTRKPSSRILTLSTRGGCTRPSQKRELSKRMASTCSTTETSPRAREEPFGTNW